jgi:hypothetical protein
MPNRKYDGYLSIIGEKKTQVSVMNPVWSTLFNVYEQPEG